MFVQDRVDDAAKPQNHRQSRPKIPSSSTPTKNFDLAAWASDNLFKIVTILLLITTVAALFFLRNYSTAGGDAAALLCIQSTQSRSIHPKFPKINWNSIPRTLDKSTPFSSFRSDKWIVVSVSNYPSESLIRISKIKGWQLLAIGNSNTPKDWKLKGAIYLSLETQAELSFRVINYLPFDSYVRKTVGYLFAIQHGAQKIYDVDDRGDIIDNNVGKYFDVELFGEAARQEVILQYSHENPNRTVVNPYIHFGQRSVWPRGLPLENVGNIAHEEFYTEVFGGKQFIQQGISNGLPDVDSVFYFTRKAQLEAFDIRFDDQAPKVALPQGTMVPVNSFNTLFHSAAFWGLMLPVSVSTMASDILRGYWAQRILWELGGYVVVYPPTVHRPDTIEGYPFSEEKDLHVNVGRLINFLVSWRSNKHRLFEKILELSYVMAEEGFWTEKDVQFTAAWLQDLLAVGYQQPRLMSLELDRPRANIGHGDRKEFVPQKLPSVHLGVEEIGKVNYEIGNLITWRKSFGNVVLIMYCAGPVERTALEWRLLYGRIFKTVIILSSTKNDDLVVDEAQLDYVYKYLPKYFERYSSADGFLFLQDDTVLNYWNLLHADKSKLWITNKVSKSWTTMSTTGSAEWFTKQADVVKKVVGTMPAHLQVNYKEGVKDEQSLVVCNSEVFYVPRRFVQDYVDLVGLVGDLDLHHKVAMPMFFLAMDSPQNFDSVFSSMKYKQKPQGNSTSFYSAAAPAVHPWKVSSEQDFIKLVRIMAAGDPLLMELV
ncbi:probable glycosyltransferase STELLO2 [Andrographis paniculata]|uniref:probable glycosyltransferase STELLO2 n=1 Tax=Andrographis paniculata TaxID=175694 RepID=UPI0021E8BB53|nr:probable glycosyltransferase STELLO2 [Andrographis paniculata]